MQAMASALASVDTSWMNSAAVKCSKQHTTGADSHQECQKQDLLQAMASSSASVGIGYALCRSVLRGRCMAGAHRKC
jgi:hypothetical protein